MRKLYATAFIGKLCLVALSILSSYSGSGQQVTIEGTGTASSHLYSPVYSFNAQPRYLRIAYIYSQPLLATMPAGSLINKLQFHRATASGTLPAGNNIKLYLMNVAQNDWGTSPLTWDVSSATLVFDGDPSAIVGSTAGYKEFVLTTSFVYTGGNLALFSEYAQNVQPATAISWSYNTPTTQTGYSNNQTKYTVNSSTTFPTSLSTGTGNHPNIKIDFSAASACTAPPNPGLANITPNDTTCAGSPITLNLTGYSTGTGQTYQWEVATSLAGPFTASSGVQTLPSYSTTAVAGTRYYRAAVTCSGVTAYSDTISVVGRTALAGGIYTINKSQPTSGTNYNSFNDAVFAISCGITGAVTFNVVSGSGPYTEQITIPAITGSSASNTVTFNGNGDTLRFAPTSTDRHVIRLDGSDYVKFDSLYIQATDGTYGWGVHLTNGANFNTITRSTIEIASTSTTQSNSAGVVASGSTSSVTTAGDANNNSITNNTIIGAYQGVIISGSSTVLQNNNTVTGNNIRDFYATGVDLTYTNATNVSNNNISRANRVTVTTFEGITLNTGNRNAIINANRIHDTHNSASSQSGSAYGIYLTGSDAPAGSENRITNNLIYNFNSGTGLIYGLYNSSSDGAFYYHNTIVLDNAASTAGTTRGFYQITTAARIEFKNNNVVISRGGTGTQHVLYFSTTASSIVSDYNNLLIHSGADRFTGNYGGTASGAINAVTLADWQAGTAFDDNSLAVDPMFIDPNTGNYTPNNAALNNKGTPVGVTTDIEGQARSATTPDIGAYEFNVVVCTNPPVPGTLATTATTVCTGESFTISINGGTFGQGQTLQWQSSPDNSAWTDITGETNTTLNTSQTQTTYYRVVYTCGASVPSASIQITTPAPASGTYTINAAGGGNFTSFNEAYNFLKCGVNGAVIVNVVPNSGPYNEQLIMQAIPGASSTNTITFNGNGNTLTYLSSNTNERAVIKLNGADYITFDSLQIVAQGTGTSQYGFGVHLINGSDSNTFSRNTIIVDSVTSSTNYAGIAVSASNTSATGTGTNESDGNTFDRNTIVGGYYGITLVSSSTTFNSYNKITRNVVRDFYLYGMYVYGSFETLIDSNLITRPARTTVSTFNGIYFTNLSVKATVSRNTIRNPFGGAPSSTSDFVGIYLTGVDALSTNNRQNKIYNNLMYDLTGNGDVTGLYNSSSDNAWYFHNTIVLDGNPTTNTATNFARGFYQTTLAAGIEFKNNIVTISRGGLATKHAIYFNTIGSDIISDYNDLYISSTTGNNYIGYSATNDYLILADWQNGTGQDAHSVSNDPQYVDPANGNYKPFNASIDNLGTPVGVTDDIQGAPRSTTTPDMGAYEFAPPVCVAPPSAGTSVVSSNPACENSLLQLSLNGHSTGTGQTYVWQSSTTLGGPYADISTARTNPTFTITATTTLYYRAAVTCSGITEYSTPVLLNVTPGLPGGIYTIDQTQPASPTNFISFNAAKDAMACGITGPVVFNVEPNTGPYNEQVIFDSIQGASSDNTITFNGFGNVITFSSSNSSERAVIKLNGADHMIFDSLVVDATGTGTYGWGVQLINNSDSNTFRKNTIITVASSTSTNYAGIVMSASHTSATTTGATLSDQNQFIDNTIKGGYYGITMIGTATAPIWGNKIIGNKFEDFYGYGVYVNANDMPVVERNEISRPTRTAALTTTYGIYFTGVSTRANINANRIHNPFGAMPTSTSDFYGIYFTSVDAVGGQHNTVSNNLIYVNAGAGDHYGIGNAGSNQARYYHNTVSIGNSANTSTTTSRGFYQTTVADGIEVKNNIFSITRGGTGAKHGVYFATSTSVITSDHNVFHIAGPGGNNHVGYNGTNRTTLADWQTSSSQDMNSFEQDPIFQNPANGNFTPSNAVIDNKGTPVGITTDFFGAPRSATTPDVGAIEFAVILCTEPPIAGSATATPSTAVCLATAIEFNLTGNSTGGLQTYQWQSASSATGPWTNVSAELYNPQFSYLVNSVSERFFRAVVKCGASTAFSTPVEITFDPGLLQGGDYTINPSNPPSATNFQSFAAAVDALECGITGPVRFLVAAGTYNEQVLIKMVPGASNLKTVTFMSDNSNASSVTLTYNSTQADSNYVVKLDSASHIIFKYLTIVPTNSSNGRAFDLANTASNDSILNNIIQIPAATSTSTGLAGIYGMNFIGGNIVIKGNTITGGSSSIYLSGTTLQSNNLVIDSNTVSGSYYYGIYLANNNFITVNNNTVTRSGLLNTSAYGIYMSNCDSAYQVTNNKVNITNTGTTVYGIYLTGCQAASLAMGSVMNNKIIATTGNTGNQYGLYQTTSTFNNTRNNVVVINTSGVTSYGLYNTSTGGLNYHNNSVQSSASSTSNNVAAYFSQTTGTNGPVNIRNNVFSHTGGGRAMYIVNPQFIYSDYNMYYTSGSVLIQWGTANNYATLQQWRDTSYWDFNSIVYQPAFASTTELTPDVADPDVWAMHGRGVQITGNDNDINGNARPVTLEEGVPDLGAYEFVPTSVPVALTAIPAAPVANTTQVFMLGTDTVSKITWGANVPTSVTGRRYSGAVPPGLSTGQEYMYFYTDFDITGTAPTGHAIRQFYLDPWRGFIDSEGIIKLGRTNASNAWIVSSASTVNTLDNYITEGNLPLLDKFTGLTDGSIAPPPDIVIDPSDSSNRGRRFWVAYGHHQDFGGSNAQQMVLYLGAGSTAANVTVRINGTNWVKSYFVPANSVISSDFIPKYGLFDARLLQEGWSEKGISIESDVPITAYAHIYGNTNSGATMLLPTGTYGFEYYAITSKQNYAANTYSWVTVVAAYDSTIVEITPSKPTVGGRQPGVPFTIELRRGEVYQILGAIISGSDGYDLTGTKVKSLPNANGECYPIAVFSGSSRTNIGCGTSNPSASGDNIIQQNFPYRAWGRRYLTAPTSQQNTPSAFNRGIFKISVKDPTTVVKRNGVVLTGLIDNLYYQYESITADYIEADKPVMVAQFMPSSISSSGCGYVGFGDPEMIYISPIEQGIKSVALYRNTEFNIVVQYLTLIIPAGGLPSLRVDGSSTFDHVYDHPNLPGYKVVVRRWAATDGQTFVTSDSAFTAITYGLGSAESYGYNAGTLVINLNVFGAISNVYNPSGTTNEYTCVGTPFTPSFISTVQPDVIEWNFSELQNITPNNNVVQNSPVAVDTLIINGITYYQYQLTQQYVISAIGTYNLPIYITHPDVEGCNSRMQNTIQINVIGSPEADFAIPAGCINSVANFNGTATTANNVPVNSWSWNFNDPNATPGNPNTANTQNATHTFTAVGNYNVSLSIIGSEGCVDTVTKTVPIVNVPQAVFAPDSIGACLGDNVTFNVQNPLAGATYNWYTTATGGTPVATGPSFTINNVTGATSYFVEVIIAGCPSASRTEVEVTVKPALSAPVVVVDSVGTNLVRFRWNAVPNATGYEVSTNNGATWTPPSSGSTGLTHTVTGLGVNQSVTIQVRALGGCDIVVSAAISATTITDQVYVPNAFSPNGDGLNDVLRVYSNVIRDMRFMVFNQWGEKIFESHNQSTGWDGTYKGKPQPSGVYMYVCDITLVDGRRIQRKGAINLVR